MFKTILLAGAACLSLAVPTLALAQAPPTPVFLKAAAQTDEFERREGRLAQDRAANPRIRDFAQTMIADHTRTTAALQDAMRRAGIPIPPPPELDPQQHDSFEHLRGLAGPAFDHLYIDQQIHAHETALAVMQAYAASGDNPVIRHAAADTVPLVEHHLTMAREIKASM